MDKYTLLLLLNLPFVVFGIFRALFTYKQESLSHLGLMLRLVFWFTILAGLVFAEQIYSYLVRNNLTNSGPLSLPDVILVTGVLFLLFLSVRLYAKNELLEDRITELHEQLSINTSLNNKS